MKLKIILFLLLTNLSFSQKYLSVGVDIRNITLGSEPTNNKSAFNGLFRFGMIGSIPNHKTKIEASVGYESFNKIQFSRYIVACGVNLKINDKIIIVPSWEGSIINRWGQTWENNNSHISVLSGTIGARYKISEKISAELLAGVLDRVDLNTKYKTQNFIYNQSLTIIIFL